MCDDHNFDNLHNIAEENEFEYDSVSMVSSIVPSEVAWAALQRRQVQLQERSDENFHAVNTRPSENNQINLQIQLITNSNGNGE